MSRARRKARGFTLIEVMVAVSLLGVLLVLLFSAMRTGIRSWQAAETHIDATESVGQTERFVVRILAQTWRGPRGAVATTSAVAGRRQEQVASPLSGGPSRFVLVAPGVNALPRPGLYRYEVFSAAREDGSGLADLWVHIDPYRPDGQEVGEPRLLQEGVAAFALRYFGVRDDRQPPEWVDTWPADAPGLPLLVEIRLQLAGAPERPLIIAAPMVAAEGV